VKRVAVILSALVLERLPKDTKIVLGRARNS
jgi:hypothetical protein